MNIPFIITIDTEGDNLWAKPKDITTKNAKYLSRFQELCEKCGFKPVYLANWEMANSPVFQEFANNIIKRKTGEIGMHLHAWNTPPDYKLTNDDYNYQPLLIEYPAQIMENKIKCMTRKLEDTFQVEIVSHRAGRWAINLQYIKILQKYGYKVDCSITPHIDWGRCDEQYRVNKIDYSNFPTHAYFMNKKDVSQEGDSSILEVPVTIIKDDSFLWIRNNKILPEIAKRGINYMFPEKVWLRPNRKNINEIIAICDRMQHKNGVYAEFMLHSSELMPGGSPTFANNNQIENLYHDLNLLFSSIKNDFSGCTLKEYLHFKLVNQS